MSLVWESRETDPADKSPSWEANSSSVSQEFPRLLCNPKVHYRIHKHTSIYPHASPSYFLKINFNMILLRLGLPSGFFPLAIPTKTLHAPVMSPNTYRIPRPSHSWFLSPEWFLARNTYYGATHCGVSCYLPPLGPKYLPHHPVSKYPQPLFLPHYERPILTHIYYNGMPSEIISCAYVLCPAF